MSILDSIKKMLGLTTEYVQFDQDILVFINAAFLSLNQIGIGPEQGFWIHDSTTTWEEYFGSETNLEVVKTYIYLKTRLLFDPPANSFVVESMNKQITEIEFRLSIK